MFILDRHISSLSDPSANVPSMWSQLGIDAAVKIPERFTKYLPLSVPSESLMAKIKEKFGKEFFGKKWSKIKFRRIFLGE
jgi:hypothetical protein